MSLGVQAREDEGNVEGLPEGAVSLNSTLGFTCRHPNVAFSGLDLLSPMSGRRA